MANPEHLEILKQGLEVWNQWREKNPNIQPDLQNADLCGADFSNKSDIDEALFPNKFVNVYNKLRCFLDYNYKIPIGINLEQANLMGANLEKTNLRGAVLEKADLRIAHLKMAKLEKANLKSADCERANFEGCNLENANLSAADLRQANLRCVKLNSADLRIAKLETTILEKADLRMCNMIDSVLDQTVLTGAKLWESNRSGWSIKSAICEYVFFD